MKHNCIILIILTLIGCGSSSNLNSKGLYKMNEFEDCGTGGIEVFKYRYRIGNWTFYHPNGKIKAKGNYKSIQTEISTRCEINEKIEFSKIGNDWKFYDQNGIEIKTTEQILAELNCVSQELDDFLEIQYCFDEKQNRVVYNVMTN